MGVSGGDVFEGVIQGPLLPSRSACLLQRTRVACSPERRFAGRGRPTLPPLASPQAVLFVTCAEVDIRVLPGQLSGVGSFERHGSVAIEVQFLV